MKNEANEALKHEDNKIVEFATFSCMLDSNVGGSIGDDDDNCRVKVEHMEASDSISILSHATAYATL